MIKKHVPPSIPTTTYPTFDDLPPLPSPPDQEKKDKIISELRQKGEQMLACATQRRADALREWGRYLKECLSMQQAKIVAELREKGEQMLVCATQRRASALREWGDTLKECLSMQQAIEAMKASIKDLELAQARLISDLSRDAADIAFCEWVVVGNQAHRLVPKDNGDMLSSLPLTVIPEPTEIEEECLDLEKEYL